MRVRTKASIFKAGFSRSFTVLSWLDRSCFSPLNWLKKARLVPKPVKISLPLWWVVKLFFLENHAYFNTTVVVFHSPGTPENLQHLMAWKKAMIMILGEEFYDDAVEALRMRRKREGHKKYWCQAGRSTALCSCSWRIKISSTFPK